MMQRRLRVLLLVFSLVILQTTIFTHLHVFGAIPDLLLVATVAVAYNEGPQTGTLFGFFSGLVLDLFLVSPFGLSAISNSVTGWAIGTFQAGMAFQTRRTQVFLAALGGVIGGTVFMVVGGVVGVAGYLSLYSVQVIVAGSIWDAVVSVPIFMFVHWALMTEHLRRY